MLSIISSSSESKLLRNSSSPHLDEVAPSGSIDIGVSDYTGVLFILAMVP
jgi:hypothetical protein